MCGYDRWSIRLQRLVLHLVDLIILVAQVIIEADTTFFLSIDCSLELRGFLSKALMCGTVLEELSDEMLVDDMALELGGWYDIAVSKLEVLEKETGAVKCLAASNADQLLIHSMVLLLVSEKLLMLMLYTYRLDVSLQPRLGLELLAANTTGLVVLKGPHDLVPRVCLDVLEVFVALVAVVVFV
jgi:hypothetical protein